MARNAIIAGICAIAAGAAAMAFTGPRGAAISETATFDAIGLGPMTVEEARSEFWRLTPAMLLVIYDAFALVEEGEIYDTLASVTHGDALEYLYLERVVAMGNGGLDEADQTIHEIKLLNTSVTREDATLVVDASWQVIGTVGHAEHLHVRGNTYSADLTLAPIAGAWRISDFDLRAVNRDAAGETFLAPEADS